MYSVLENRGLIRISGEDAIAFLQGLVTSDIDRLHKEPAIYAALLSPQGKFLHDFFLIRERDAILVDCEKARMDDLLGRLKIYKLRSKVTIETLPAMKVAAIWNAPVLQAKDLLVFPDPRMAALGWRAVGDVASLGQAAPFEAYDRMRLELGVPDGSRDMIVERSLLLECGFEELSGVDFEKGCYVGQEVTARSKHRAQLRKSLHKVRALNGFLPVAGTPILSGDVAAGEMRSSVQEIGLAILKIEEVAKAKTSGMHLRAGDIDIEASIPGWMAGQ